MLIWVMYQDGNFDIVKSFLLDKLITSNKIKKFLRLDGWATIGFSQIRGIGGSYKGTERRGEGQNG